MARMGNDRGAWKLLVGKPEGKRPVGRPKSKVQRKLDFTKYRGDLLRHKQSHKDVQSAKQDSICGTMSRQCHKIDLLK